MAGVQNDRKSGVLRFTHLHVENWRNFSKVDVDLQRRVFLLGPNASGKSNFLDIFRFLHDVAAAVGGGLQAAVEKPARGGLPAIRCLSARASPDVLVRVRVGTDEAPHTWEYEISFGQLAKDPVRLKSERVTRDGALVVERPTDEDRADPERLRQTSLEQLSANQAFRGLAGFFASTQYLHLIPQLVRDPERYVLHGREPDPYGGDFLDSLATAKKNVRTARLKKILRLLRAAVPQISALDLEQDTMGNYHLVANYRHWRPRGKWQNEKDLSDGTLRLIGLFWSLLTEGGPLLLEEPELSLHTEIVRRIPQLIARAQSASGRQAFISSHSRDLLLNDGIGLDEVLVLVPGKEGTSVTLACDFDEVRDLLESGVPMADAVMPLTRPENVHQLTFPWDRGEE